MEGKYMDYKRQILSEDEQMRVYAGDEGSKTLRRLTEPHPQTQIDNSHQKAESLVMKELTGFLNEVETTGLPIQKQLANIVGKYKKNEQKLCYI